MSNYKTMKALGLTGQNTDVYTVVGYINNNTTHRLRSDANLCDMTILQAKGKHHSVAVYLQKEEK